ncbi:GSK3B-interacting protein-like [Littorina saxatilis]|uniref:GSKIP domain-containing protein n=1 Tax=Littorina saxatilis TaxID=31220 RepID=A0AAN9BNZ4_9CAEN
MAECADEETEHTLRIEAQEVVKEVAYAVDSVKISTALPISDFLVYMNLRTKENDTFCVELSEQGFRVVGRQFDTVGSSDEGKYYETIYSLLDSVSSSYRNSFSETLMAKLRTLQPDLQDEESMDTK